MTAKPLSSRIAKMPALYIPRPHGALIAAALVGAAATAGTAAYSSSQQKKAAAKNQAAANSVKSPELPDYPDFVPHDWRTLSGNAEAQDRAFYQRSDADFRARHKPLVKAEKLFEAQTLKDQQGNTELMPQLQREMLKAGLGRSLGAFGGDVGTLAPGSAGEANVAVNLGQDIMGFQQQNRDNRQRSLMLAEQLFPRREFGLSGADFTNIAMQNTAGQNNHAQALYGSQVEQGMLNHGIATDRANTQIATNNAQAAADAQMAQAIGSGISGLASAGAGAYGQYKGGQTGYSAASANGLPGLGGKTASATPVYRPAYTQSASRVAA